MKSARSNSFFMETRAVKRSKIDESVFDVLPREMWLEIIKKLDKKSLREIASTCRGLRQFSFDTRLFINASWPELNYQQSIKGNISTSFQWDSMGEIHYGKPRVFVFENGDVAVGEDNGKLTVLKLRDNQWRVFGRHQIKQNDGVLRGFPVKDVILLQSGDLASCSIDGIRVWDRVEGHQKYRVSLPEEGGWSSRPQYLLELSNTELASGCWDGSVQIWRLTSTVMGDRYKYQYTLPYDDKLNVHHLKKITKYNNELIGEFNHFIMRWDWKSNSLIERIEFTSIKSRLFDKLISICESENNINAELGFFRDCLAIKDHMTLMFNWSFPHGYVGVMIGEVLFFLVKIDDAGVDPLFFGMKYLFQTRVTNVGDIVSISQNGEIACNWDSAKNLFRLQYTNKLISTHAFKNRSILPDGMILFFNPFDLFIHLLDPYTGSLVQKDLECPEGHNVLEIRELLQDGSLLGRGLGNVFYIWDLDTGKLKQSFAEKNDGLAFLPNGDLLRKERKTIRTGQNVAADAFTGEDKLEVYRFGLRK